MTTNSPPPQSPHRLAINQLGDLAAESSPISALPLRFAWVESEADNSSPIELRVGAPGGLTRSVPFDRLPRNSFSQFSVFPSEDTSPAITSPTFSSSIATNLRNMNSAPSSGNAFREFLDNFASTVEDFHNEIRRDTQVLFSEPEPMNGLSDDDGEDSASLVELARTVFAADSRPPTMVGPSSTLSRLSELDVMRWAHPGSAEQDGNAMYSPPSHQEHGDNWSSTSNAFPPRQSLSHSPPSMAALAALDPTCAYTPWETVCAILAAEKDVEANFYSMNDWEEPRR
jgi:hypothetical protein